MHALRCLLGSWGVYSVPDAPPDESPKTERPRRHHYHHHHLRRHEKNYDMAPLGGNRPISVSLPTTPLNRMSITSDHELENERRRERRRLREQSRDRHPSKSHSSTSSLASQLTSNSCKSKNSSRESRETSRKPKGSGRSPKEEQQQVTGHVERSSAAGDQEGGGISIAMAPSSSASSHPSSPFMGFVMVEGGRKRCGTNGSETSVPYITATPPTPSPLEQARRRNTHPLSDPPYPVTPPASDIATEARENRTSYIPYHPLPAALRIGRPRARAHTTPSAAAASLPTNAPATTTNTPAPPPPTSATSPPTSATSPIEIGSSGTTTTTTTTRHPLEDPYQQLHYFTTTLLIDDSASMTPHWHSTSLALETLATLALPHSPTGIDLHFMNHPSAAVTVRSASQIRPLFASVWPSGCTPTGQCLDLLLRAYLARYSKDPAIKPLNVLVLTDGEPTDDPESVIVHAARRLERLDAPLSQVGIQFLQIGDEPGARDALSELDDNLEEVYGIRDIVDTTRYTREEDGKGVSGSFLVKALLGGVNRRWDRREG